MTGPRPLKGGTLGLGYPPGQVMLGQGTLYASCGLPQQDFLVAICNSNGTDHQSRRNLFLYYIDENRGLLLTTKYDNLKK